jgi:hypothetical protein
MGLVMRTAQRAAISADRDLATKQAFDACVAAVKDLIGAEGPIKPDIPVGRLTANEWGWIVSTIVSAWVWNRAAQAAAEGLSAERAIRATSLVPNPWFCGTVEASLPMLADACPHAPWDKAIGEWTKSDVVAFLVAAHGLIGRAIAARDAVEAQLDGGPPHPDIVARELNRASRNACMTVAEQRELETGAPF